MVEKKVVIIGAGVAGLSAGCYLQMNGFKSEIYELHEISGGLCTSWKRNGYTFDGCIHWLVGTSPANPLYDIWTELGGLTAKTEIVNPEIFVQLEDNKGNHFTVFTNVNKLEAEMLRLSPEDNLVVKELTDAIKFFVLISCSRDNPPPMEVQMTFKEKVPAFFKKWIPMSVKTFTDKISNQLLKQFILKLSGDSVENNSSIFFLLATLGYMHAQTAGYPIGGSRPFVERIEQKYLRLGGKVHYKARVKEILVENNNAIGVKLKSGEKIFADIVISAADGYDTIFNMLKGKYVNDEIKGFYNTLDPFPSICQVSLGVAETFTNTPHAIQIPLEKPIKVDPKTELKDLSVRIFNFDPTLAPSGKTAIISFFVAKDYQYWIDLREKNRKKYNETKERLAREIINLLEMRFPGIRPKVEVIDVSTPATYIRFTNNWKGSYEGWMPNNQLFGKSITETLPGLENFYMVGQWTRPGGGLPPAAMSAKKIVEIICKKENKELITS